MKTLNAALMLCLLTSAAWAKRPPPKPVEPITIGEVQFSAPNEDGRKGVVRITKISTGESRDVIVYTTRIWPLLETDVQWDFVKRLSVSPEGLLVVETEKGRQFTYNPEKQPQKTKSSLTRQWIQFR